MSHMAVRSIWFAACHGVQFLEEREVAAISQLIKQLTYVSLLLLYCSLVNINLLCAWLSPVYVLAIAQ